VKLEQASKVVMWTPTRPTTGKAARTGKKPAFYARLREEQLEAILLGGDISEAASVTNFLAEIADVLRIAIYFVLGNHDFYGGSRRSYAIRARVASCIQVTDSQRMVGNPGW
jgi:hypothetical protein